jgi:hypothetical protein
MSRTVRICLALLAGTGLIWLIQIFAATIAAMPSIGKLLMWLRANELPQEIVSPGIVSMLPVFGASLLVGLVGFRLPERKDLLFLCLAAPFVAFSLYSNVGMLVSAGNSLRVAVTQPLPWLVVCMTMLGLGSALPFSPRQSAA